MKNENLTAGKLLETKETLDKMLEYRSDPMSQLEVEILEYIPKIASALGMEDLNYFVRSVHEGITLTSNDNDEVIGTVLAMEFRKDYKAFYLTICPNAIKAHREGDMKLVLRALVHEMSHLYTADLAAYAQNRYASKKLIQGSVEETTERIAILARRLLNKIDPEAFNF